MRLDIDAGSTNTAGQVSSSTLHVRIIEWHARKANSGNVYIGGSDVSTSNGRELAPGATVTWDFSNIGKDNEPGLVVFNTLYAAFEVGGDRLDWTIFTTDGL